MTKIKICGLKSEEDISYANDLKPDYIGFVFLKGRARYVSPEKAARLRSLLHPSIQCAGVFVNEPIEHVAALLQSGTSCTDRKIPIMHRNYSFCAGNLSSKRLSSKPRKTWKQPLLIPATICF